MKKLAVFGGKPTGKISIPRWPIFDQRETAAVTRVVRSGWWAFRGPEELALEKEFARYNRAKYAVAAANGTITIRMALEALGVGPGDEVIVPGLTWQATAAAVLDVNAVPVLVDIDPRTYTIDPAAITAAITRKTKCILPVHLYGRIADMDSVRSIARKHRLFIVEDCAHQHGSRWRNQFVGSLGDIGSFSLQSSKIMNAGEGGLLITNRERSRDLLQSLKMCGRPFRPHSPTMQSGNFRMTEFQSAIARVQLSRLEKHNALRDKNVLYMEDKIARIEGLAPLYRHPHITRQAYYGWNLRYDPAAWGGVPKKIFGQALNVELYKNSGFGDIYEPLNNSPLFQPHSKKTHRLSPAYWQAIDPRRFDLPVCKKAYEREALLFSHVLPLTNRTGCDTFVAALEKLRNNTGELVDYFRKSKGR